MRTEETPSSVLKERTEVSITRRVETTPKVNLTGERVRCLSQPTPEALIQVLGKERVIRLDKERLVTVPVREVSELKALQEAGSPVPVVITRINERGDGGTAWRFDVISKVATFQLITFETDKEPIHLASEQLAKNGERVVLVVQSPGKLVRNILEGALGKRKPLVAGEEEGLKKSEGEGRGTALAATLIDKVNRALGVRVPTREVADLRKMVDKGESTCYISKFGGNEVFEPGRVREQPNDSGDILRDSGVIGTWETVGVVDNASLPAEVKRSGSLETVWIEELSREGIRDLKQKGILNTGQTEGILRISRRTIKDVKIGGLLIRVEGHCNTSFGEKGGRRNKTYSSEDLTMVFSPDELKQGRVKVHKIV